MPPVLSLYTCRFLIRSYAISVRRISTYYSFTSVVYYLLFDSFVLHPIACISLLIEKTTFRNSLFFLFVNYTTCFGPNQAIIRCLNQYRQPGKSYLTPWIHWVWYGKNHIITHVPGCLYWFKHLMMA
jgi:hypothetical protein